MRGEKPTRLPSQAKSDQPCADRALQYNGFMLKTVVGTYKSGVVELNEPASDLPEGKVLVTFLEAHASGTPLLSPAQIADLRGKLAAWEEDWNAPGMEAYDRA